LYNGFRMTNFSFREHHLFNILNQFDAEQGPLDLFLRNYFRAHKAVGSKDRRFISETIYGIIRWKGLIDHLCEKPVSWEKRYRRYVQFDPMSYLDDESIPLHIRVSFPKPFFHLLASNLGEREAAAFCIESNFPAPTTLRVNPLKETRASLLEKWKNTYSLSACSGSPWGIVFHKKINFLELPEFKAGFFEIQDEASQLIADLVGVSPGEKVLDYCAGSGGKTLAFAHKMQKKGQIYLHDIRPSALEEAKKRLRRAGIQNAQCVLPNDAVKKRMLRQKMDWVLADVPCSGTGTLRRNPDMKWKFDLAMIERLKEEQRSIFEEALSFVRPGGHIVYATCSILSEENENQLSFFKEKFNVKLINTPFVSSPKRDGMDGFFGAVLKRQG
jgi:16S rRNA (cytosine967-C5)-methyltransferase